MAKEDRSIVPFVYSIACACSMYCLWKVASTGAHFPALFFDRTLFCDAQIVRRAELFNELRYVYYAFAYAVIPIGSDGRASIMDQHWSSFSRRDVRGLVGGGPLLQCCALHEGQPGRFLLTLLLACIVAEPHATSH